MSGRERHSRIVILSLSKDESCARRARSFCFAAIALLAACGGSGTQNPGPNPSACPLFPIPAPPQMTYPAPNATGVPDGNVAFLFTYQNGNLAEQWSAPMVTASSAPTVNGGPYTIVPTPGPLEYSSTIGVLRSKTTYTVQVVNPPQGGQCSDAATLGTFTTQ